MKSGVIIFIALLCCAPPAVAQSDPASKRPQVVIPSGDYGPWQYQFDPTRHSVLVFNSKTGDLYTCPLASSGPLKCTKAVRDPG
jgi:hypothetical protein